MRLLSYKKNLLLVSLILFSTTSSFTGCFHEKKEDTKTVMESVEFAPMEETWDSSIDSTALENESLPSSTEETESTSSKSSSTQEDSETGTLDEPFTMPEPTVSVKGIYVTGPVAGSSRMDDMIELVNTTELNTMVIDIKNDEGNITYQMAMSDESEQSACIRYVKDMPGLIDSLHEDGIYVIGRIVCFKDPILAANRPDLALCKPNGSPVTDANGLAWVNPYEKDVWDYLCRIAEAASADGFDEIQFDYVRFPIGNDANEADYGVDLETHTREMCLEEFFQYTVSRLHESNIVVGADLFGTVIGSDVDRDRTGQNYETIVSLSDIVCPMIYPSHYANGSFGIPVPDTRPYDTIYASLTKSKEILSPLSGHSAIIRPWLQCFTATWVDGHITYDKVAIEAQIQAVSDAGYEEWILWNASNHYDQLQ